MELVWLSVGLGLPAALEVEPALFGGCPLPELDGDEARPLVEVDDALELKLWLTIVVPPLLKPLPPLTVFWPPMLLQLPLQFLTWFVP